jgi:hypothetical protein
LPAFIEETVFSLHQNFLAPASFAVDDSLLEKGDYHGPRTYPIQKLAKMPVCRIKRQRSLQQ